MKTSRASSQNGPGPGAAGALRSEFAADPDMADLVAYFLGDLQQRVDKMTQAWQASSPRDLRVLVHQLRGAAGGYGFPSITESAAELEEELLAANSQPSVVHQKFDALIALCKRVTA